MMPDAHVEALSRYMDEDLSPQEMQEVERLLATSAEARGTLDHLLLIRRELRGTDGAVPDVTGGVLDAIRDRGKRRGFVLSVAAALAAGIIGGVVFIGLTPTPPAPIAAAEVPAEVVAAQSLVTSLEANLQVVERGRHPAVPERRYTGTIAYSSPESLWIEFNDRTEYPSDDWVPNHTIHVVEEGTEWSRSVARCPTEAMPTCTPAQPRVESIRNREPFALTATSALDVVVPVGGFVRAGEPGLVGFEWRGGRETIGVEVTAAQLAGLIDGLFGRGNWREVHPTDPVELWLDVDTLVPVALSVYPADTSDRALWAIRHGYVDQPGEAVLEVQWSDVQVNEDRHIAYPDAPDGTGAIDAGFVDGTPADLDDMAPKALPDGMSLHRSGTIQVGSGPDVSIASWSDGRAWLKLEWTREWSGNRLFGDFGLPTRRVRVGSGVAYLDEKGERIALHGTDSDAVVSGSLPTADLLSFAESLPIDGRPVPHDWAEAATATLDAARDEIDGLLVPAGLEGFSSPAIRVEAGSVAMSYAGAGDRTFLLTQTRHGTLPLPLEAKVRGIDVRGNPGRYTPERGLLEWVEGDVTVNLRSTTLSLVELLEIAESLEPA